MRLLCPGQFVKNQRIMGPSPILIDAGISGWVQRHRLYWGAGESFYIDSEHRAIWAIAAMWPTSSALEGPESCWRLLFRCPRTIMYLCPASNLRIALGPTALPPPLLQKSGFALQQAPQELWHQLDRMALAWAPGRIITQLTLGGSAQDIGSGTHRGQLASEYTTIGGNLPPHTCAAGTHCRENPIRNARDSINAGRCFGRRVIHAML